MSGWSRLVRHYSRNIGIIAHIDAGKTTTTERMLYMSGTTKRLGDVDHGDTVTDFLPAERERGITIQSAAISFGWRDTPINLIDTPGHADFTFEVIRSLRVLDGAVTVLDAVAGVEAQTEKVWSQAAALGIPRVVYVNKMDRAGAGYGRTVKEIVSKLKSPVALLNIPLFEGEQFKGVVDVLELQDMRWEDPSGREVTFSPTTNEEAVKARQSLIDTLADLDEGIVDLFMEQEYDISSETLRAAIRKHTLSNQLVPVLCGASFRNIGVQPLLDAVVDFLPEPAVSDQKNVSALAFKVTQDPIRGPLCFVRVYSGTLKRGAMVYNTNTKTKERASQLLQMQADSPVDLQQIKAGDIGVITGSQHIKTGDTLVAHATKKDGINQLGAKERELALVPIAVPPPVFMTRISPKTVADKRSMDSALAILMREDPSLQVSYDDENGQWLLSGMGELHLEIAQDRLHELKANIEVGDIMITLKETTSSTSTATTTSLDGFTTVTVTVGPYDGDAPNLGENNLGVEVSRHPFISKDTVQYHTMVGITPVVAKGGKLARAALRNVYFDVKIELAPEAQDGDVSPLVREAAQECIDTLDDFTVLEPFMQVTVQAPQEEIGKVMTDLSNVRRGTILGMGEVEPNEQDAEYREMSERIFVPTDHTMYMSKDQQSRPANVQAIVPLRTMIGYLSSLRSLTHGRGTFQMAFDKYEPVPLQDVDSVVGM